MGLLDPLLRKVLHIAGVALPQRGKWAVTYKKMTQPTKKSQCRYRW